MSSLILEVAKGPNLKCGIFLRGTGLLYTVFIRQFVEILISKSEILSEKTDQFFRQMQYMAI